MSKLYTETTVGDIQVIETRGPWKSKSGGELNVRYAWPKGVLKEFLDFDNQEFDVVEEASGMDIRGLRSYMVSGIPAGSIGGTEFHKARTELVTAFAGRAVWRCADLQGGELEVVLDGTQSVVQKPGLMHTYEALDDDTGLLVVCNTLFDPDDPRTHDTYSMELFEELRQAA